MRCRFGLLLLLLACPGVLCSDPKYIFFMKAPTSPKFANFTWLQQDPTSFTASSIQSVLSALELTPNLDAPVQVGVTYQWEMLDCFLSPHSCNTTMTVQGILNFLDSAASIGAPVQITLDTVQFYYQSNLWNWWDPTQPGYDPENVNNVEWTGWDNSTATKISWRNWGSQFRMPTPQPNLASPALLSITGSVLKTVIGAIRHWYEAATPAARSVLKGVKLGEEVDVGVNFFYYKNGNQLLEAHPHDASHDPRTGPDWSKGLSGGGGMSQQGYNMLRTLGIRSAGEAPTRDEVTAGVQHYFKAVAGACVEAWPALSSNGLLQTHGGAVSDPLMIKWDSPMISPAVPGYSVYNSPSNLEVGQPGLLAALRDYDPEHRRFVVAEGACMGCSSSDEWFKYFKAVFGTPYGNCTQLRYYNLEPFLQSNGSVSGLHKFLESMGR